MLRHSILLIFFILVFFTESISQTDALDNIRDSIYAVLDTTPDPHTQIEIIITESLYNDNAPFTKSLLDRAKRLANSVGTQREKINVALRQAQYFFLNRQIDTSAHLVDRIFRLPDLEDNLDLKGETLVLTAQIDVLTGDLLGGIDSYLKALEMVEGPKTRDKYIEAYGEVDQARFYCILNNNLGNLYNEAKDYPSADRHYDKAIAKMMEIGGERYAATTMMNRGISLFEQGLIDSAIVLYEQSIKLKKQYNATPSAIAMSRLNLGRAMSANGDYDKAAMLIDTAISVFTDIDNNKGLVYALSERGILHLAKGETRLAKTDFERCKSILQEYNIFDYTDRVAECLYKTYRRLGEDKKALLALEEWNTINDSLYNINMLRKVGLKELNFTKEKEKEKIRQEANARAARNQSIITIISILALALALISYLLYRNSNTRKKANDLLTEKNKIITKALDEKDTLLREIHHRVKNNLQFISSLLNLQSRNVQDQSALSALQDGQNRVKSMALIHQNLYQEDNLTGVQVKEYFEKLTQSIFSSYNISSDRVFLKMDVDALNLDVDTVIPLGLIVNELVTNALKHAFADDRGTINVTLREESDNTLLLSVADDGVGISTTDVSQLNQSFGYKMLRAFEGQLDAELSISADAGTTVSLRIKEYKTI